MRPLLAALLAFPLAVWAARPALARPLRTSPVDGSSSARPGSGEKELIELRAKLAAAYATLDELRTLALKESRTDDVETLAAERGELLARHGALTKELDLGQQGLSARIQASWIMQATMLARDTKAGAKADVPGRVGPIMAEEILDERIAEFWKKRRAELESEQKSFGLARARAAAVRRHERLLRGAAAAGGGAVLLLLLAAAYRRVRR